MNDLLNIIKENFSKSFCDIENNFEDENYKYITCKCNDGYDIEELNVEYYNKSYIISFLKTEYEIIKPDSCHELCDEAIENQNACDECYDNFIKEVKEIENIPDIEINFDKLIITLGVTTYDVKCDLNITHYHTYFANFVEVETIHKDAAIHVLKNINDLFKLMFFTSYFLDNNLTKIDKYKLFDEFIKEISSWMNNAMYEDINAIFVFDILRALNIIEEFIDYVRHKNKKLFIDIISNWGD